MEVEGQAVDELKGAWGALAIDTVKSAFQEVPLLGAPAEFFAGAAKIALASGMTRDYSPLGLDVLGVQAALTPSVDDVPPIPGVTVDRDENNPGPQAPFAGLTDPYSLLYSEIDRYLPLNW